MNEALLIFGMMLVTFGVRYPVLAILGRMQLPGPALRALRFVPVAVLTAITVPALLLPEGEIAISPLNAYLGAGIVSGVVAWRTKNLLWTIVIGMGTFLLWRLVVNGF